MILFPFYYVIYTCYGSSQMFLFLSICECTINIINRNIKVSDQEKKKINRNRDKIRELVNPKTSQKKRKKILVQKGSGFLGPLHAAFLGSLVGPLLKSITGG